MMKPHRGSKRSIRHAFGTMKTPYSLIRLLPTMAVCGLMPLAVSCRKESSANVEKSAPGGVVAPELLVNGLKDLPGAVLSSQADSPIHWQPWTKATLERASDAKRLVFCVIAMPQQPGFQGVLDALARDPSIIADIHSHYVPVLVDGGPVNLEPNARIVIGPDGALQANGEPVGNFDLVTFENPQVLEKLGQNMFRLRPGVQADELPADNATVMQGYLEGANVEVVREMVHMIEAQRSFEAYQKVMHTAQEADQKVIREVASPR